MQRKLTLRMDEDAINRAKQYAAQRGVSVSRLVENFFAALDGGEQGDIEMSPLVKSLWGILEGEDVSEEDYRAYIEEKHS